MTTIYQKTLVEPIHFEGVGLHSGKKSKMTILPSKEDQGIVFKRVDLNDDLIKVLDNRSMIDSNSLHISCVLAYEDGSNIAFENNGLDYHIRSSLSNLGAVFDVSVDIQVLHGIRLPAWPNECETCSCRAVGPEQVTGVLDLALSEKGLAVFDDVTEIHLVMYVRHA